MLLVFISCIVIIDTQLLHSFSLKEGKSLLTSSPVQGPEDSPDAQLDPGVVPQVPSRHAVHEASQEDPTPLDERDDSRPIPLSHGGR